VPWQPLLRGVWKDRALESIQAIVDDLAPLARTPGDDPSLESGTTGLALLHGYLAQAGCGQDHAATAVCLLQQATALVADEPVLASLYSGLAGVGWALAHLGGRLPGLDAADDLAEIDEALLLHLEQSPWSDDYDLIRGLVGLGVYALERLSPGAEAPSRAAACLERVLDHLTETAERRPEGVTWFTKPAWLSAEARAKAPGGYYNLGLAHGVPGVVALLGQVGAATPLSPCERTEEGGRVRALLDGAVAWLLAQERPGGFAGWVEPGKDADRPARLAWCYGDPGVAAALLGAARCVQEPAWERQALAIARRAARRPAEHAGVRDAGLCHGAAGLAHLFNRMYQATGEPELGEAARLWLMRTLQMRQPGRGVGGYEAWMRGDEGASAWVADGSLLVGAAGIALALLAAVTPVEPAWDRMLLVAIPPTASS
jgi:lantibiotic modifying enzyme